MRNWILLLLLLAAPLLAAPSDDVRLIDVHAHLGSFKGYDLSLPTLLDNIHRFNIEYAFVSNIDGSDLGGTTANLSEQAANDVTLRVCAEHAELKPLAWARPGDGDATVLEPFLRDHHFFGLKFHPEFNHFNADADSVVPYLRLCEKYHVPACFHCGDSGFSDPERIYRAARRVPQVPVILYHMGFGSNHRDAIRVAQEALQRHDASLYLETAQVEPSAVLQAIQAVGADHVLFGTDATYYGRQHYEHYAPMLALLRDKLTRAQYRLVVHDNAVRLFKLDH